MPHRWLRSTIRGELRRSNVRAVLAAARSFSEGLMLSFPSQYAIGAVVNIKALERPATVRLVRWDGFQTEYFLVWWDEGKRYSEWLCGDEIV